MNKDFIYKKIFKKIGVFYALMVFLILLSFVKATDVILSITILPGQITFGAPDSLSLGSISLSQTSQNKEGQFNDYFRVSDLAGLDIGYNTTVVSDGLVGPTGSSPLTGIYLMAGGIGGPELLLGTTGNVKINSALSSDYYSIFNVPITYIYRPEEPNYGKINKYGDRPWIRIVIPPYTQPGMYSGVIYFDI